MDLSQITPPAVVILSWAVLPLILALPIKYKKIFSADFSELLRKKIFHFAALLQISFFFFAIAYGYVFLLFLAWLTDRSFTPTGIPQAWLQLSTTFFYLPGLLSTPTLLIIGFGLIIFGILAQEVTSRFFAISERSLYNLLAYLIGIPFLVYLLLTLILRPF